MTRILLVRHGQSEWNAVGRWQGQADPPLSRLGECQARAAAEQLPDFDLVVASDLARADRTAAILTEPSDLGPIHHEPGLRERAAGAWEGLSREQIEAGWPGFLAEQRRPAGFESDDELLVRTHDVLDRLAADHPDARVLAICHGGVIRAHERALGDHESGRVPNLGGRWFEHTPEHGLILGDRVILIDEDITTPPDT